MYNTLTRAKFKRRYYANSIAIWLYAGALTFLFAFIVYGLITDPDAATQSLPKAAKALFLGPLYIISAYGVLIYKAKLLRALNRAGEIDRMIADFNRSDTIHVGRRGAYNAFGREYVFNLSAGKVIRYSQIASISFERNYKPHDQSDVRKHTISLNVIHDLKSHRMLTEKVAKPSGKMAAVINRIREVRPDIRFIDD